jgi:hypothetical protein
VPEFEDFPPAPEFDDLTSPAVVLFHDKIRRDLDDVEEFAEFCRFAREYPRCYRFHFNGVKFRLKSVYSLMRSLRSDIIREICFEILHVWRKRDFVIRKLGNQPACLAHPVRVILRLHPFRLGAAGGCFVGCSQPAFGRALQVGFKHIGSDFHFKETSSMGEAVFLKPCTRKPGPLTGADRGLLTFRSSHSGGGRAGVKKPKRGFATKFASNRNNQRDAHGAAAYERFLTHRSPKPR